MNEISEGLWAAPRPRRGKRSRGRLRETINISPYQAAAFQAGCRWFEPGIAHHLKPLPYRGLLAASGFTWLKDLSRQFKRHRQGRPGWLIEEHRDRLRLRSDELPPRPGEHGSSLRQAFTLTTPPGPSTASTAREAPWRLEAQLLEAYLKNWKAGSRSRQMAYDRARRLWNEAGWP